MQCVYDSDEDIAWGPMSLKEKKSDLIKGRFLHSSKRHTVHKMNESDAKETNSVYQHDKCTSSILSEENEGSDITSNFNAVATGWKTDYDLDKFQVTLQTSNWNDYKPSCLTILDESTHSEFSKASDSVITINSDSNEGESSYTDNSVSTSFDQSVSPEKKFNYKQQVEDVDASYSSNGKDQSIDEEIKEECEADESGLFLNDTLEAMEQILNSKYESNIPCKEDSPLGTIPVENLCSKSNVIDAPKEHSQSKSGIPILIRSPGNNYGNFKIPETPKLLKSAIKKNPYKDVVSPVGLYIKYSPQPVIKRTVPPLELKEIKVSPQVIKQNKENFDEFPAVIYTPSKTQIVKSNKKLFLPPSLEKKVNESGMIKHERKLNHQIDTTDIHIRLLHESELTVDSISNSILENSVQDISYLTKKENIK